MMRLVKGVSWARLAATLSVIALAVACDNPVHSDDDHAEAAGVRVRLGGVVVAESRGATIVVNNLPPVTVGAETGLLQVDFIAEDGDQIDLSADADFSLGVVFANPAIASYRAVATYDGHIRGVTAGSTTVQFELRHGDHPDFTSQPFGVTVTAQ